MSGSTIPKFDPGDTPGYVYDMMAEHLALRIQVGELAPNTPLPSERRLAQEYDVSLGTARHATRLLRYCGLVVTVKSKGTYIAKDGPSIARAYLQRAGSDSRNEPNDRIEVDW